ncbi:MAG: tRNA lysidine(34) synthetase TilS [Gemmatimonadota bacterium]|nr:tRNA lysidine(34) synthetase TilS [Gemmatimonadota bacterium]
MSGTGAATGLAARFREHLTASGCIRGARHAVVAVSGGVDSMTLLHLLRFGGAAPSPTLHAAHLDHRMRAESAADAAWVGEVCDEWGVTCHLRAAPAPVRTEAEGRELRYGFLAEVAERLGTGAVILTAHTADDQAETVLFRIARGSGPRGLRGIHPGPPPSPVRPLLPFRRADVEAYAAAQAVPHREDPTNRDLGWTRNRIRHEILPALEAAVPGASAALVSLADTSRAEAAALDQLLDERIAALALAGSAALSQPPLSFDREALAALPDPLLAVLLRRAAARMGGSPGRAATAALLCFVREAPSGRRVTLEGGVAVEHHLGTLHFRRLAAGDADPADRTGPEAAGSAHADGSLADPPPRVPVSSMSGDGGFIHGACRVTVSWRPVEDFDLRSKAAPDHPRSVHAVRRPGKADAVRDRAADRRGSERDTGSPFVAHFAPGDVRFPLVARPWAPGDRVTLPYGKKKVKKILLEARIPADRREGWPVVADAEGAIVWVPGSPRPPSDTRSAPKREVIRLEVAIKGKRA